MFSERVWKYWGVVAGDQKSRGLEQSGSVLLACPCMEMIAALKQDNGAINGAFQCQHCRLDRYMTKVPARHLSLIVSHQVHQPHPTRQQQNPASTPNTPLHSHTQTYTKHFSLQYSSHTEYQLEYH